MNRDNQIDFIKGILITCVILGHYNFLQWPYANLQKTAIIINESIYLFHMPLFFAISLLYTKPFNLSFLKSNGTRILIPFTLYVWRPNFVFELHASLKSISEKILTTLKYGNFQHGTGILWFLPTLFILKLIHSIFAKLTNSWNKFKKTFILLLITITLLMVYNYEKLINPEILSKTPWGISIALFIYPICFIIYYLNQKQYENKIPTIVMVFLLLYWDIYFSM